MSTLKSWIAIFSLVTIGAGCGGGGDDTPDASNPTAPDAGQVDGGGGNVDGGGGDVDAGNPAGVSCDAYCGAIMTNCTGANAQYDEMSICMSVCEAAGWDIGSTSDDSVSSLGCRIHYAGELAAADPGANCPSAGATGNNVCGTWCEAYCDLNLATCSGRNAQYDDEAACLSACQGFQDDGAIGDDMGDTVQCRIFHSGYPALRDPQTACSYTGEEPGNYCIDPI